MESGVEYSHDQQTLLKSFARAITPSSSDPGERFPEHMQLPAVKKLQPLELL